MSMIIAEILGNLMMMLGCATIAMACIYSSAPLRRNPIATFPVVMVLGSLLMAFKSGPVTYIDIASAALFLAVMFWQMGRAQNKYGRVSSDWPNVGVA
ncbi:MAG: hypothetical protein ABJ013_05060 [Halioglobus sp.]